MVPLNENNDASYDDHDSDDADEDNCDNDGDADYDDDGLESTMIMMCAKMKNACKRQRCL